MGKISQTHDRVHSERVKGEFQPPGVCKLVPLWSLKIGFDLISYHALKYSSRPSGCIFSETK